MPTRRRVALLLSIGLVVGVLLQAFFASRQPSYHGRSLEVWVQMQFARPVSSETIEALHEIGPNAMPYLLQWLRHETPVWKGRLCARINPVLQKLKIQWRLSDEEKIARADGAARALRRLGPDANALIPELVRIVKDPKANAAAVRAMEVLGGLGEAGVPPLMEVLNDRRAKFRAEAAESLGCTGSKRADVIVLLLECTHTRDAKVADSADRALQTLKLDATFISIINYQESRADARAMASVLFGVQALSVVEDLLTNRDEQLRQLATNALRKTHPDVLEAK